MIDRFRERVRPRVGSQSVARGMTRQRHMSRREREHRQRQLLYIFTAIAGAIVIVSLVVGASYQYYFYPRQVLASVNGQEIQRRDYWKVRELQLRQDIAQQAQQLQFMPSDQAEQIRQSITIAQQELEDVPGAPVSADTLGTMVDDLVVLQHMSSLGVTITDSEIDEFVAQQFAPVPLAEPTPTATIEPTAAAWATATGEAQVAEATANANATATATVLMPTATPDPEATPSPTPDGTATPDAVATLPAEGTPDASPEPDATPEDGTPTPDVGATPSPTPSPTPNAEEARATSEAIYELYRENYLDESGMSRSDFERLIARPQLAREKVREYLINQIPARAEQVHAQHILVQSREAADAVLERLQTEDFDAVAREVSIDTGTAGSGGDLGWFTREVMVAEFADAAFALQPGEISQPVQTRFGWHIIRVIEREEDRPLTLSTLRTVQGSAFERWLTAQRLASDINASIALPNLAPEETQPGDFFQAPPDAPIPPTPTPIVPPTVEGETEPGVDETPEENGTPGADATPGEEAPTTDLTPTPTP
jgi:parvulin-like peptidyl-prolyl isomerase